MYQQTDIPFTLWLTVADNSKTSSFISRMFILTSTFLLILDNKLMPDRFRMHIPRICAFIIDYLLSQIIMAVILYVWTSFQSMLCMLLKELLLLENDTKHLIYHQLGGDIFLGYFTTAMSLMTFWYTFKATGSKERFKEAFFTSVDAIVDVSLKIIDDEIDQNNCDCSDKRCVHRCGGMNAINKKN